MVVGLGIGALASVGLALPTGALFGYGYGYGVRAGYHSFKPSKSDITKDLHLSPNPMSGAQGAGLLSSEERTGSPLGLSDQINSLAEASKIEDSPGATKMVHSPLPGITARPKSSFKSHEDYTAFVKGLEPYKSQSVKYMAKHRTNVKRHRSYR